MTGKLAAIPGGDGVPEEPDWESVYSDVLDIKAAHDEWGIVIRELHSSSALTVSNAHAIKRLVQFRIIYDRAMRHVAEHGAILPAKRAKVGQHNPFWSVMTKADEAIRVLEAELGLAPTRRGKLSKVTRGAKGPRAADAYRN